MGAIFARLRKPKPATDASDSVGVEFAADVTRAGYAPSSSGSDDNETIEASSSDSTSEYHSVCGTPGEREYVHFASSPDDNETIEASSSDNTSECRSVSSEQLTDHPGELENVRSASSQDHDTRVADDTGANSPNSFVECLIESRERIVEELEELDDILGYLLSNHAISKIQIDVIMTQKDGMFKVRELLDYVHRRGEEACRSLVAALRDTDQIQLCELSASLKEELDQVPVRDVLSIDQYMTEMKGTYKEKIENRNEQEQTQYENTISLDQHLPVIINHEHRPPDAQTRTGFDEFNIQMMDRKQLTLDGIFLTDTDKRRPHSVLMLGGPGMGKTSLCFTILNRFALGQWGGHHFIFLMLLKELGDIGHSLTLADLLFDYNQTAQTKTKKQRLIRQLQKRQDRILFIFDGYDECDEFMTGTLTISAPSIKTHPGVILRSLVRGDLLRESQILLTSRPFRHVDMEVDRVVELAGLSNQSVRTLLDEYKVGETGSETAAFLENHEDVASMLSIPINIPNIVSYLTWLSDSDKDILLNLPKTKSSLYSKNMLPVLTQYLRSEGILLHEEHQIWHHLLVKPFLCKLAKLAGLAISKFEEKQILFKRSDLERCEITEKDIGGLMSMYTSQTRTRHELRPVDYFYFNHLLTFEWCGGLDTASRDIKYINNLIKRNDGYLDGVLIFCAGLLGTTEGQMILACIYDIPKHECQQKVYNIMNQIVISDRCRKPGGSLFAIEVFNEASFFDPGPLLPLLAPDGKRLEIADIALSKRQAVSYFVKQLHSSQDMQTGAITTPTSKISLDTVRLHFTEAGNPTGLNSAFAEASKLKKLKQLLIETGDREFVNERPLEKPLLSGNERKDTSGRVLSGTSGACMICFESDGGQEVNTQDSEPNSNTDNAMVDFKDKLIEFKAELAVTIAPHDLWNHLEGSHVITKPERDRFTVNKPEKEQVEKLLDHMDKRPFKDCVNFCIALMKTNQAHVVRQWLWEKEWTTLLHKKDQAMFQKHVHGPN